MLLVLLLVVVQQQLQPLVLVVPQLQLPVLVLLVLAAVAGAGCCCWLLLQLLLLLLHIGWMGIREQALKKAAARLHRRHDSPFADLPSPTEPTPASGSLAHSLLGKHPAMLSTSPMDAMDAAEAAAAASATVYRLHVEWSGLRQVPGPRLFPGNFAHMFCL